MKKIIVSKDLCIGCGACVAIDENDFKFNDQGFSEPIKDEIDEVSEQLQNACSSCPTSAIKIVENEDESIKEEKSEF